MTDDKTHDPPAPYQAAAVAADPEDTTGRRRPRHPAIAVAVIALGLYVMWFLREDLTYFFQPGKPTNVGDVAEALAKNRLKHNTHVTVNGAPDRKNALILEARAGGYDSFVRLQQSKDRVFVQRHREHRGSDKVVSTRHTGRLLRFESLPYAAALREYFAANMNVAHDLEFTQVAQGLLRAGQQDGRATISDIRGSTVRLRPESLLWINVAFPNEWVVQFRKTAYPQRAEAAAKMQETGLPHGEDSETSRIFWRFATLAEPDQVPLLVARFKDRSVHAEVVRRQLSYSARWDQLKVHGKTIEIHAKDPTAPPRLERRGLWRTEGHEGIQITGAKQGGGGSIKPVLSRASVPTGAKPLGARVADEAPVSVETRVSRPIQLAASDILFISTSSPLDVEPDAMVLVAGVQPRDKWYYVGLYLLLLGFVLINIMSLILRGRNRQ